jgi:hypothetical protein
VFTLLLDEHISHDVATGFRARFPAISIHSLGRFEGRKLTGKADAQLLGDAAELGLTLVTYDIRTILPLTKNWAEQGRTHCGVIFVSQSTIPSHDFGSLIRALGKLAREDGESDWTNRVEFLKAV